MHAFSVLPTLYRDAQGVPNYREGASKLIIDNSESFEEIGNGYFSRVFAHPEDKNKCIKVSINPEDGGVIYAYWCMTPKIRGKKGIPQVYQIIQIPVDDFTITFIELERYPYTLSDYIDQGNEYHGIAYGVNKFLKNPLCDVMTDIEDDLYPNTFFEHIAHDYEYMDTLTSIRNFFNIKVSMNQEMWIKAKLFKIEESIFDVHTDNIMIDKNGDLIFTDPLSIVKTTPKNR